VLPSPLPDAEATLEKSIRYYEELGFPPERVIAQLIRSGYPRELVSQRFPQVSLANVPTAPARRESRRRSDKQPATTATGADLAISIPSTGNSLPTLLGKLGSPFNPATTECAEKRPPADQTLAGHKALDRHQAAGVDRHLDRVAESDGVSFQYVPLIQCSFPHADPGEQRTFTRRNGWLELTLSSARADTGLPYGVPARLLTIYCASEAVRTRSPEIFLGRSVHEFLRRLDVPITRGERGSLRVYANQLLRLIHCAISIDEDIRDAAGRTGLHIRQALFVEEARLWWDESGGVGQGSSLVLSPVLFQSILERSAPLSTAAIKQLRKSPMDLDVYAWLVHRLFRLTRPNLVTWSQLSDQIGHSYALPRKFRQFFVDSLQRVTAVYPEARVKVTETGLLLSPSKPHVPREISSSRQ
jgi:hypothetical protein